MGCEGGKFPRKVEAQAGLPENSRCADVSYDLLEVIVLSRAGIDFLLKDLKRTPAKKLLARVKRIYSIARSATFRLPLKGCAP